MPLLSIIIVTWNSEEFIKSCLESIFNSQVSTDFEVVVIDNASQDETVKIIQEIFHQVKLISNQKNLGYAKGNNQGIEIARGGYILLLNPDVDLKENCLQLMLDFLEGHKEIDALGPQLLNLNGTIQPSCREFPDFSILLWEISGLSTLFPKSRIFGRWRMGYFDFQSLREVDQPMGSCLLLRRKILERIGILDERFPIFFNDVDLCYRMKKNGGKLYFFPEAKAFHYKGGSTQKVKPEMILSAHLSFFKFLFKYKKGVLNRILVYFSGAVLLLTVLFRLIYYVLRKVFLKN
ncbi:MAG: glycosyltransferase family 2 protein [candidate division Zixibacteria bacterium]|nr:glycosyltransferase family 2 protein [candidate division Zixibacteria bacterium]